MVAEASWGSLVAVTWVEERWGWFCDDVEAEDDVPDAVCCCVGCTPPDDEPDMSILPFLLAEPVEELLAAVAPPPVAVVGSEEVDGGSLAPEEPVAGGRGRRRRSQAWRRAWLGVIRCMGSHSRQRRIKSRKSGSWQPRRAAEMSREPGGPRALPRRDRPPPRTTLPSDRVVALQYRG
jgi:hypothetical protein